MTIRKVGGLSLNYEQIRSRRPFTEEELVRRALRFLNRGTVASWFNLTAATELPDDGAPPTRPEFLHRTHDKFREAVTAVMAKDATPRQREAWRQAAAGLVRIESLDTPGAYHYAEAEIFEPFEGLTQEHALLALVLSWLLDPHRRFGVDLRRCPFPGCAKEPFFLVGHSTEDRRRRYCCPEHTIKVNRSANSDRAKDYKARKKAIAQLAKQYPSRARELVTAIKQPGLTVAQLVQRAQAHAATRKHK